MDINKQKIKDELVDVSNTMLAKYNEPYVVDSVSVMNAQGKTTFLGSLRVFDERNLPDILNDVELSLSKYGKLSVRDEKIIPCCSANYIHISFNITIDNT